MISTKGIIIGSFIVFTVYLSMVFGAAKFANDMSKRTEQNFADAVRVMQGK